MDTMVSTIPGAVQYAPAARSFPNPDEGGKARSILR